MNHGTEHGRILSSDYVYDPRIEDPMQFLDRPFSGLEVGGLSSPPTKTFLRFLPTLPDESGLVLQDNTWYVIKASDTGIPAWLMPNTSDVLLHSHTVDENEEEAPGSIPSLRDYLNCSENALNFISSDLGLTQFWAISDTEGKRDLERELNSFRQRFGRGTKTEYLKFLKEIGARFTVYPWDEIDDKKILELMGTTKE